MTFTQNKQTKMKKLIFIIPVFLMTSCVKINADTTTPTDPNLVVGDYVCDCTYISANSEPKKEEATKLSGKTKMDASFDCDNLQGKYTLQFYSGTCVLK